MSMPTTNLYKNKNFSILSECLDQIEDPRMKRKITYPLAPVILMAICASIGGANNWVEVAYFCNDHKQWMATVLGIQCGVPSHDTFNRIFNLVHPEQLTFWLVLWIKNTFPIVTDKPDVYHCDGKVLKSYASSNPLTLVRAWSEQLQSTVGMKKVIKGNNEITTLPQLLKTLHLKGKIVTLDAIGAQKTIVKTIGEKQGDYVIALKANHHQFYRDVRLFMDDLPDEVEYTIAEQHDKNHGRIEKRYCIATETIDWLWQKSDWHSLRSLVKIKTTITMKGRTYHGNRYFISSLPASAPDLLSIIRSHWSIENKLHWPLDRYFEDDKATIRDAYGAPNASFLRSIAISVLQNSGDVLHNRSFQAKRQAINRNPHFLISGLLNKA